MTTSSTASAARHSAGFLTDRDRLLRLCNEWNSLYKMPKVYLEVDDPNRSPSGRVVCEQWFNLESGIHQELVNQLTSTFFSASFGFWRWLERQDSLMRLVTGRRPPARRTAGETGRCGGVPSGDVRVPCALAGTEIGTGGQRPMIGAAVVGPLPGPFGARGGSARRGRGRVAPRRR